MSLAVFNDSRLFPGILSKICCIWSEAVLTQQLIHLNLITLSSVQKTVMYWDPCLKEEKKTEFTSSCWCRKFFFSILQLAFTMCKESHIFSSSLIITIKGFCQCVGSLLMFPVISFCFRFSVSLATFVLNGKRIDLSAWAMENNKCISVQFVFAVLIFS